jgi:hypothetical protein
MEFLKDFKWESQVQEKGYGNLVQFLRRNNITLTDKTLFLIAVYFIERDHESNEYWRQLVGDQVSNLQSEIKHLQDQVAGLEYRLAPLIE